MHIDAEPINIADMGGGFWDIAGKIATLAAMIGMCAGGYQLWVPDTTIQRNHERIAAFVGWGARAGWLDTLKSAVARMSAILTWVYGEPSPKRIGIRAYLTVGAWKMSARIATFLVFVLPTFAFAGYSILEQGNTTLIGKIAFFAMLLLVSSIFIFDFYITRDFETKVSSKDELFKNLGESVEITSKYGAMSIFFGMILVLFTMSLSSMFERKESTDYFAGAVGAISFIFFLLAFIVVFLDSIKKFGFHAAIAFALQFLVIGGSAFTGFFLAGILLNNELTLLPSMAVWWSLPSSALAVCAALFAWLKRGLSVRTRAALMAMPIVLQIALVPLFGTQLDANEVLGYMLYPVFAVAIPLTLLLYAAVLANSLPDWLSIAATRTILTASLASQRSIEFARFIALDFVIVALCCCLTLAISVIAFALAFVSNWLLVSSFQVESDNTLISFFAGGSLFPFKLLEVGWNGQVPLFPASSFPPMALEGPGEVTIAVIVLVGTTSAIPTILNAIMMVVLICGRGLARTIGPTLLTIHSLLTVDADTSSEQRARRVARSTMIVGFIGAAALSLIILALDGVGRIVGG